MKNIIITDSSLRDGNHSVKHTISLDSIEKYCQFADKAGIPIVEVGHGNGLAASSLLIGKSPNTDKEMLTTARKNLKNSKLGVHTKTDKTVYGVLMMSALITAEELAEQAKIMEDYGAEAIIIMDSTGTYLPHDVKERISLLKDKLNIKVGFHAHNNLGCAVANSLIAVESGAELIDACIRGFGAGAGNAPLELILPVFEKVGYTTGISFEETIKEADRVMDYLVPSAPITTPINVLTGLTRLFSGFEKPIVKASKLYGIEYSSLIFELGNRKLVAGQEDLILEVAQKLKENK